MMLLKIGIPLTKKTICTSSKFNLQVSYHVIGKTLLNKIIIAIRLQKQRIILFETQEFWRFKKQHHELDTYNNN